MDKQEYLNMTEIERFKYLNKQAITGKNYGLILEDISMTKEDLAREGFYWVGNKFIRKAPLVD